MLLFFDFLQVLGLGEVDCNGHFCFFFQFLVLDEGFFLSTICIKSFYLDLGLDLVLKRGQFTCLRLKFSFQVLLHRYNLDLSSLDTGVGQGQTGCVLGSRCLQVLLEAEAIVIESVVVAESHLL